MIGHEQQGPLRVWYLLGELVVVGPQVEQVCRDESQAALPPDSWLIQTLQQALQLAH